MKTKKRPASLACLPVLMASLLAASLLMGCDQKPAPPAATGAATASEPATSTSRDFGQYVLYFNAIRTDLNIQRGVTWHQTANGS